MDVLLESSGRASPMTPEIFLIPAEHTDPETVTAELARAGAVMTIWHSPAQHYLVGDFAWLSPNRIFWFAANGNNADDGHVLEFDRVTRDFDGLNFYADGNLVGLLAAIDRAHVDDSDDYRVAWQIWQVVAPARRALVEGIRTEMAADLPH